MPIIESQVDRNGDEYKRNRERMLAAIAEFRDAEKSVQAASEKSRERFAKRKQLMPRERIALLLDRGAPFLELMPLAGYRMHDDKDGSSAGGGSVSGIGYVEGVRCVVTASNSAIKGGTVAPSGQRKGQRVQQIVLENKLPVVNLVESGGANLLYQAEIFVPGGRGFANQARMSARGIPQVTVVHAPRCSSPDRRCSRPRPARSRPTRSWAVRRCMPRSPVSRSGWPRTTPTASAWRAT
jgi:geranyl-CoA carboxylase beta subunit